MLKLKFTSNIYGSLIVPIYRGYIHNYGSNDGRIYRFGKDLNNKVTILEEPTECFSWFNQIKDIPSYDECEKPSSRVYLWEKNSKLALTVSISRLSTSVIGDANQRGLQVICYLKYNGKYDYPIYTGITYPSPHPFYTGNSETSYGIATFFYDSINKCFFTLKPPSVTIQDMQRLSGYDNDYGNIKTILVTSNKFEKNEIRAYTENAWTFNGGQLDGNTKIKYGEHLGRMIHMDLANYDNIDYNPYGNPCKLYELIYQTHQKDPSFDFDEGTIKDPNNDDPGSETNPDYDNDIGGDGNHDDTSDTIEEDDIPTISGTSNGLTTSWNLTPSQLATLANKLWNPDMLSSIKQYFTNPMDAILALSIIPVSPNTTSGTIHLGGYNTEISAQKISSEYMNVNLGSIAVERYYGSYLDYAPFTKISCILPYIGEVDLDPDQVMKRTVSVKYHINCVTGELCAYILADGNTIATYTGNCAKQLPICQTDYSNIIASTIQVATTAITAGAALAAAPVAAAGLTATTAVASQAAASNIQVAASTLGSVMNAKPTYKHASQLGTGAGQLSTQAAYLIITRPNLDLADNYKSFVGYPCNKRMMLALCKGYTQVEASNLSVPSATLDELSEIKELLLKGVII